MKSGSLGTIWLRSWCCCTVIWLQLFFFCLVWPFSSFNPSNFLFRYTKYLYPFECTKRNLSNPTELQAAIEGNKREGRRGSYGAYPEMALSGLHPGVPPGHPGLPSQISPMSLVTGPRFNGNGTSHPMPPSELLNYLTESPSTYLLT